MDDADGEDDGRATKPTKTSSLFEFVSLRSMGIWAESNAVAVSVGAGADDDEDEANQSTPSNAEVSCSDDGRGRGRNAS